MAFHDQSFEKVLASFGTNAGTGLSEAEASRRLAEHGPNKLIETKRDSPFTILLNQFKNVMVLVLLIAAVISALTHDVTDAFVILIISIVNAAIGFIQEYKADRAMAALAQMAQPQAKVFRAGKVMEVPSAEIVPGDILLLESGSRVSADARILESAGLKIEEAALTGESLPIEKTTRAIAEDSALADQTNMAFMGTVCVYGRGRAVVTDTGMNTQLGKIAKSIQEISQGQTPLQKRLAHVGWVMAMAGIGICVAIFFLGWLQGIPLDTMLVTAIALAVAAIPESLPAVVTIVLTMGIQRMIRKRALVKKLPAVETLGSVTVICSDKTGTLTQNQMTVREISCDGALYSVHGSGYSPEGSIRGEDGAPVSKPESLRRLIEAACLCNDATLGEEKEDGRTSWKITGDPTEGALLTLAGKTGVWKKDLEASLPRTAELPFDSERKLMTTVHRLDDGRYVVYTKGAVDQLLERCGGDHKERIMAANQALASSGRRVLAFGYKILPEMPASRDPETLESDLTFMGLVGMVDPPREEVKEAVRLCRSAQVRPIMITGDHPATAATIARELRISGVGDEVITGQALKKMSPAELAEKIEKVSVFARVSPEDKIKIVQALQARNHIVAMTGDGVNDAPALKGANIGVAMGIMGTDVSKEAADMILLDDNFATIVSAVSEGRRIYDNIRKFIRYMLGTNAGEVLTMGGAILLGMPLPLLPLQILWINLVTDSLPALALGLEPAEKNVMQRPPRPPEESLFSKGLWQRTLVAGVLMTIGCLWMFDWALQEHTLAFGQSREEAETAARSMLFMTMGFFQLFNALAIRSEHRSVFAMAPSSNWYLYGAVLVSGLLQAVVIYFPPLQDIFKTTAVTGFDLIVSLAVASSILWVIEIEKAFLSLWARRRVSFRESGIPLGFKNPAQSE
jgi:P-type Ca2+ transporter type 2C